MSHELLANFENQFDLDARRAAQVMGIAYPTYAAYRNMSRVLPVYHVDKVILLCNCDGPTQKRFLEWKLNGSN